jgi:hypothetical protein
VVGGSCDADAGYVTVTVIDVVLTAVTIAVTEVLVLEAVAWTASM